MHFDNNKSIQNKNSNIIIIINANGTVIEISFKSPEHGLCINMGKNLNYP